MRVEPTRQVCEISHAVLLIRLMDAGRMVTHGSLARWRFILPLSLGLLFLAVNLVKIIHAPTTTFYEGDDAAISAGVARLCTKEDIGPYFYHPRLFSNLEYESYLESRGNPKNNPLLRKFFYPDNPPYYRYNSLLGLYFIGSLTCSWGPPAVILSRICFLAGAILPALIAIWLRNLFKPLSPLILPLCYLSIAISPEMWISGSVYINDKILSIFFLTVSLLLITNIKLLDEAKEWLPIVIAGTAFGISVLFRFDSILFLPGLAAIILSPFCLYTVHRELSKKLGFLFLLFTCALLTYLIVALYMGGSIIGVLSEGSGESLNRWNPQLIKHLLSAGYGLGVSLVFLAIIILVAAMEIPRLRKSRVLTFAPNRQGSIYMILLLLVIPEILFFIFFPYSPKYLLFSSSVLAGLVIILPIKYFQTKQITLFQHSRLPIQFFAWIFPFSILLVFSSFVYIREIPTNDGLRYFGAHLRTPISIHPDSEKAEQIFKFIDNHEEFNADIFIKKPSWMFEEAIAYQAAIRGWKNQTVPISATRLDSKGAPSKHFSLNQYTNLSKTVRIFVPTDYFATVHSNRFKDEVFMELATAPVIFYEGNETLFAPSK